MKTVIIIGAGPAGLTAAYELLKLKNLKPIILESSAEIGGLSKTINYKGNRIDIGGHRFFSKDDKIIEWWLNILPLEEIKGESVEINYHQKSKIIKANADGRHAISGTGSQMLIRNRKSRIFYNKHFFAYPVTLNLDTIRKLGWLELLKIGASYIYAKLFRHKRPKTLEDFLIDNFGRKLYTTFFKEYMEKVWGVPCNKIPAAWGRQRIKDLSLIKTLLHAIKKSIPIFKDSSIQQKNTSTSLIEKFMYPSMGPGRLWEAVAEKIIASGGEIHRNQKVVGIVQDKNRDCISEVTTCDSHSGKKYFFKGDYFISSMPVQDLITALDTGSNLPPDVKLISAGLEYRDFVIVGILIEKKAFKNPEGNQEFSDNWIYIQDKGVQMGRIQFFNNWSPYMVKDQNTIWLGLEYFYTKGDTLWNLSDVEFKELGITELNKIGFINNTSILDSTIIRVEKAYPAYFGKYADFDTVTQFLNRFENMFLIGRNGMHKYNNTDHSMLTAMEAVKNIKDNIVDKSNIWSVNTEESYNEKKV